MSCLARITNDRYLARSNQRSASSSAADCGTSMMTTNGLLASRYTSRMLPDAVRVRCRVLMRMVLISLGVGPKMRRIEPTALFYEQFVFLISGSRVNSRGDL